MNAVAKKVEASTSGNFRERKHRYSKLPVKDVLKIEMDRQGVRNTDLQVALGYAMPNVIAMIKSGSMRLPENKVLETAQILKIDPAMLLGKVIEENNPVLWDTIVKVLGTRTVSENEFALVEMYRKHLNGHDVDPGNYPELEQAMQPVLTTIFEREAALAKAAIERIDRLPRVRPVK